MTMNLPSVLDRTVVGDWLVLSIPRAVAGKTHVSRLQIRNEWYEIHNPCWLSDRIAAG